MMDFEAALRHNLAHPPASVKTTLLGMLRQKRGKLMQAVLDSPPSDRRARKIARWEAHVRVDQGIAPTGPFDWSTIDWAKAILQILGIIFSLLLLFAKEEEDSCETD